MIKFRNISGFELGKPDGTLTYASGPVNNYSLFVSGGVTYLIMTERAGDDAYIHDYAIPAYQPMSGYDLSRHVGDELVVDDRHFTNTYAEISVGDALTIASAYKVGSPAYDLKVVEKCKLGGRNAVVAVVANPT